MPEVIPVGVLLSKVFVVFSLAVFGVLAKRFNLIRMEAQSSFADVLLYIGLPALGFVSLSTGLERHRLVEGLAAPILSLLGILFILGLAWVYSRITRLGKEKRGTFMMACSMPNTGFLGFPVVLAVLGTEGLAFAILYDLSVTISLWSIIIWVLQGSAASPQRFKSLITPASFAIVLGLGLNIAGIRPPTLILEPLMLLGQLVVPLAMLFLGFMLATLKFRPELIDVHVLAVVVIKLVVYPCLMYGVSLVANLDQLVASAIVLQSAMPSMTSTAIFAHKFGGDRDLAITAVFVTTLLSVVSIPVIYLALLRPLLQG